MFVTTLAYKEKGGVERILFKKADLSVTLPQCLR